MTQMGLNWPQSPSGCLPKERSSKDHLSTYKQLPAFFFNLHSIREDLNLVFYEGLSHFHDGSQVSWPSGRLVCSPIPAEREQCVDHLTSYPAAPRVPCGPILPGAPCRERIISPGVVTVSISRVIRIFGAYGAYRGSDGSPGTLWSDVARLPLLPHGARLTQWPLGALAALEREQSHET